ncbi:flavohemoprotein-like [Artemia franciscana]|uniref:flavohemoprotein-like n=1 Tax=Artemia franciscana TaxID=6661 RepID=UPI0032DA73CE
MEIPTTIEINRTPSVETTRIGNIVKACDLFTTSNLVVPEHIVYLSPFQKQSVKIVWNEFRSREKAMMRFFERFFLRHPEEKDCFEIEHGFNEKEVKRVECSLDDILRDLEDRNSIDSMLEVLARHHKTRGINRDSFERFSLVFLEFIMEELEGEITEFDLEAWAVALRILVNVIGLYL